MKNGTSWIHKRSVINIRYAQIRKMDISNGDGLGVALFVQGCHFKCKNCFNSEAWDFNGGKEWTQEVKNEFLKLIDKPYITRVSILGGEPLADENVDAVLDLVNTIKDLFPNKSIWLYTGYKWEDATLEFGEICHSHNYKRFNKHVIVEHCDVLVDGQYVDELRDLNLKFRGSSNQRLINVQKSLEKNEVVLWSE